MSILKNFFLKTQHIILYGSMMAVLIFLLKWMQWKFLIVDNSLEIYIGLIAVFFTILGIWVANQLVKPKVERVIVEKEILVYQPSEFEIDQANLEALKISKREYEVLQLMAKGDSNAEIAKNLFVSISTVKTHVYNLFRKMDVKNRVQIIEKAKRLKIIA